jgi:pimeloyl-ACP methyl ester carboxylesterase
MPRRCRSLPMLALLLLVAMRLAAAQDSIAPRQVEVDGHAMNFVIAGSGSPTIVLEAGGGFTHREWDVVQKALVRSATVVSYDRPGLGASAPCNKPETAKRVATELSAALRSAGLRPPYVLVGHSTGGLYARVFTSMFPSAVSGLVLVDPAPEHFYERVRREQPALSAVIDQSPDAPKGAALAAAESTLAQAAASDPLPAIPIVLLTRSLWGNAPPEISKIWTEEHRKWVDHTPTARFVVAEQSGHVIPVDKPQIVIDAVLEVIRRAREGSRPGR